MPNYVPGDPNYDPRLDNTPQGNTWNGNTWVNPQGQSAVYQNGQWLWPGQTQPQGGGGGSSFSPQAGYGWTLQQMQGQQDQYIQMLRGQQQMELQRLDMASKQQMAQQEYQLRLQLQAGEINQAKYELDRKIAQQESEFARSLAQKQLEFQHQQEMDRLSAEIAKGSEMRQERELQAKLAANPQDWVAYEFYKRAISGDQTQGIDSGGVTSAAATAGQNLTDMNGNPYEAAPPAYNDQTLQTVATNLFNPTVQQDGYNPNMKGTGAFGTTVEAPNTLTRGEAGNLSTSEIGMLSGLLKAGVVGPDGKRVALDPEDYFKQASNSWVPTLAEGAGGKTAYS